MKQWQKIKLCDALIINPIEKLPKGIMAKKISMEKLLPFHRDILEYEYSKFSGGSKFRNNDTIMARITPCLENGKRAKVGVLNKNEIGFGSTEFIVFRKKENISDADFIYYLICSDQIRIPAIKSMVGSSGRQRVQIDVLKELIINLPPLDIQKKIAGVLGALDDKIELNNKINNNLEQQAQALFKSWFVDIKETSQSNEKFGYIPQNATVKKVGELPVFITDYVANGSFASLKENVTLYQNKNYAYFIRNTDLKSNSFEVYVDEHSYKFLSKSSLFGNEIIISNVGDVGSVFLCPKLDLPMTLGNNIIMLRAETDSYLDFYLYIWFKWSYGQELIQGIKGGSAQPKFNKTDFKGLPVILPSQQQLKEFNAAVTPVFNKISQNNQENIRLVQLRDTLLPKLMSGEIDVSNVDISALTSTDKLSFTE